jgi:hypothetical protein
VAGVAAGLLECTGAVAEDPATGVEIVPGSARVSPNGTVAFTAAVAGSADASVQWSLAEAGAGAITSAGLYTAPPHEGVFHLVARSVAHPSAMGEVAIEVASPDAGESWPVEESIGSRSIAHGRVGMTAAGISTDETFASSSGGPASGGIAAQSVYRETAVAIAISPRTPSVVAGSSISFSASVTGTSNTEVEWSLQEASGCGSVTASGVYTAPAVACTCHVVATSSADPSMSDVATVSVTPRAPLAVAVAVAPHVASVTLGGTLSFSAGVTGTANTAVSWSVREASGCGTVTQDGIYTAPTKPARCHVVAKSIADPSKINLATVTVATKPAVTVAVSPRSAVLQGGETASFRAIVTGTSNAGVSWAVLTSSGCGSVTQDGVYTAPATARTCYVFIRSKADPSKTDYAPITVKVPIAISVAPHTASVSAGGTVAFTATVTGTTNTAVSWSVQETSGCGTVTQAGVYTAPAAPRTCHVIARSRADASKSDTATIAVTATVAVSVAPRTTSVSAGGTVAFTATVTGTSNTGVMWSVQEATGCGAVTQAGVYTAPAAAATCHVVARSQADASKSDTATVAVTAPIVVSLQPSSASVFSCQSTTFTATVSGASNTAVAWSVQEGAAGGSITTGGTYTAPSAAGTYHVVATSQADPSKSVSGPVTVTDKVLSVTVNPPQITIPAGGSASFTATVTTTCGTTTEKQIITAD